MAQLISMPFVMWTQAAQETVHLCGPRSPTTRNTLRGNASTCVGGRYPQLCSHGGQQQCGFRLPSPWQLVCGCFLDSPESIKNRNDVFYLVPERSCVPDSPVWYSTMSLGIDAMTRMLNRLRPIREIQEAHLTAAQIPAPAGYYN